MPLLGSDQDDSNWLDVLSLWEKVVNWPSLKPSAKDLEAQIRMLLILIWHERDWLIETYPDKKKAIDVYINSTKYWNPAADLANAKKHRVLRRQPRANAADTKYGGRVELGSGAERMLHFIRVGDERHVEIMRLLRGAIDEIEELKDRISAVAL